MIKYIGRTTDFKGKTLWEIIGNLKNFGVGRMIIRSRFQRYPEPSYFRILKVLPEEASKNEYNRPRKVVALVERVFRGHKIPKPIHLHSASYKPDYVLIPKDQEHKYEVNDIEVKEVIVPRYMDLPPLLKEYIKSTTPTKPGETVPEESLRCKVKVNMKGVKNYRIAEEGEKPTIDISLGLGKPTSPHLYANVHFKS